MSKNKKQLTPEEQEALDRQRNEARENEKRERFIPWGIFEDAVLETINEGDGSLKTLLNNIEWRL